MTALQTSPENELPLTNWGPSALLTYPEASPQSRMVDLSDKIFCGFFTLVSSEPLTSSLTTDFQIFLKFFHLIRRMQRNI